ncbi:MAG: hypothetical protein IPF62_15515 [Bacteroidetes bacterium]|nr:hypothetical protein [Bacteroidota bacterium]
MLFSTKSNGQNVYKQNNVDSAAIQKRVQQEYIARDSILNALKQKKINDSIARVMEKIKIQQYRDSLVKARNDKRIKDSTDRALAKQKLLDERRIKDSLELVKKRAMKDSLDNVAAAQERLRKEEMRIRDSINLVRIKTQDSIAFARKREADSLKAIRIKQQQEREAYNKYVNSDKYKDSVATRKKQIMDSTNAIRLAVMQKQKEARDQYNDSVKLARQRYNDSVVTERTRINDSIRLTMQQQNQLLKEERTRIKDSLVAAREKRADSLELVRKEKEKKDGSTKKLTDEKKKLALAIKMHDAKQKEWSNEKLLKRKWNLPRKIYQNTVTRYNYHYNAKRKYDEAIQRITKNNKEDFTKPIALLPYNTEKDGTSIASDMDTVIKKASFSTQIHDPRSKWFDNLYFLMGKASYAKNDYDGAITTFQFIANEYKDTRKGQNNKTKKENC